MKKRRDIQCKGSLAPCLNVGKGIERERAVEGNEE